MKPAIDCATNEVRAVADGLDDGIGVLGEPGAVVVGRQVELLVEDSATVRMLESMLLIEAGFEVDAVADGREALARATAQPYSLLVTGVETRGLRQGWWHHRGARTAMLPDAAE